MKLNNGPLFGCMVNNEVSIKVCCWPNFIHMELWPLGPIVVNYRIELDIGGEVKVLVDDVHIKRPCRYWKYAG